MAILILVQMKKLPYEVKNFWGGTGTTKKLRLLNTPTPLTNMIVLSANFLTVEVALTAVREKLRTSLGFNFYKARI